MTYRVICTYHPDVGTFRGKRGAWRVYDCYPADAGLRLSPVQVIRWVDRTGPKHLLCIHALSPRQRNSWCNPRSMLTEWLAAAK